MAKLLFLGLTFLLGCFQEGDFDLWWHLRTGELIPERGVPFSDWFSFITEENAWIDVQWGFQVVAAWVHDRFGVPGLVLGKSAIATFAVGMGLTAYRSAWPVAIQLLTWLPALFLLSSRIYTRPEVFTLLFLAINLTVLFHAERHPSLLWLLPPLQILWANFHGLFIFGPILLAMYFVEAILRMDQLHGVFRHLMPVTLLTMGGCFVSPYLGANVDLVWQLWQKMGSGGQIYKDNITELVDVATFWKQGGRANPYVWLLLFLWGLGGISLLAAWREILLERRVFRVLVLLAFGYLSLQATRNGSAFGLVAGITIAWNFGALRCSRRWTGGLPTLFVAGVVALSIYAVASGRWYLLTGENRRLGVELKPNHFSFEAMAVAGKPGMPARALIFHLGHAATFIHQNGPDQKVFMDARLELYTEQQFREYLSLRDRMQAGDGWQSAVSGLGVDMVLADGEQSAPIQATLFSDPDWQAVFFDDVMAVFVRKRIPLPEGVSPIDFRGLLFADTKSLASESLPQPTLPPEWWLAVPDGLLSSTVDKRAAASLRLGMSLGNRVPQRRREILWYTAQQGIDAIRRRPWEAETFRNYGVALALIHAREQAAGALSEWNVTTDLVEAMGIAALHRAVANNPWDFSSNYYLQYFLDRRGAVDLSLVPLKRLENRTGNWAQAEFAKQLPSIIEQREKKVLDARSSEPNEQTPILRAMKFAERGLLGEGLKQLDQATIESLPPEQLDRVGTWLLAVGSPRSATTLYRQALNQKRLPLGLGSLRLGCATLADGQFAEAHKALLVAAEHEDTKADACYALAVMYLLAGDGNSVQHWVEVGLASLRDSQQESALRAIPLPAK
ncbi:MAG: hypothetical protein U1D30_18490 [Planctomycetota bacterium]